MSKVESKETPRVTIVVSPRERFEQAIMSLTSCLKTTDMPYELIYIDGGSPSEIASELKEMVEAAEHTYFRFDTFLTPNDARNFAMKHVTSEYVAFIDNDVVFEPNWLSELVNCADETNAGLVTPTILVGPAARMPNLNIHHAGGVLDLKPSDKGYEMFRRHGFEHEPFQDRKNDLARTETGCTEFHVVLARKEMLDQIGPLDPNLCGFTDEIDMAFCAQQNGWKIIFEPNSVVAYAVGKKLTWRDIPYFCVRWESKMALDAEKYFYNKWNLAPDFARQKNFLRDHRRHAFAFRWIERNVSWRLAVFLGTVVAETIAFTNKHRLKRPERAEFENFQSIHPKPDISKVVAAHQNGQRLTRAGLESPPSAAPGH